MLGFHARLSETLIFRDVALMREKPRLFDGAFLHN
jgi:hypothetical protein